MDKSLKLIQKYFVLACFVFFVSIANFASCEQVSNIENYIASQNAVAESELSGTQMFISVLYRNTTREIKSRLSEKLSTPEALAYWGEIDKLDSYESIKLESVPLTLGSLSQELFFLRKAKVRLAYERILEIRKRILSSSSSSQIQKMFSRDLTSFAKLYKAKKYDAAVQGFEFLVEDYPFKDVADVKFLIAESYFELKNYPKAISSYEEVLKLALDENDKNIAIEKLSLLYLASVDSRKLTDLANSSSQNGTSSIYLGIVENKKGNNLKSINSVSKVPLDSKEYENSKFIQGQLSLLQGKVDDSIGHFTYLASLENPLNSFLKEYSKVKLAQIAIGQNQFVLSDSILMTVDKDFGKYDEVLTTQMWCAHFIQDSPKVIELGEVVLKEYSGSNKTYEILSLLNFHKQLIEWPNQQTEAFEYVFDAFLNLEEAKELNSEYIKLTEIGIDLKANLPKVIAENDFAFADSLASQLRNIGNLKKQITKNYLRIYKKFPALTLEIKNDLNKKLSNYFENEIIKEERKVKIVAQKNGLVLKETDKKFDKSDANAKNARQKRDEIYGIYVQIEKDINSEVVSLGQDALGILSDSMEVVRVTDALLMLSEKERVLLSAEQADPVAQGEVRDLRIQKESELKSVESSLNLRRSEAKQKEAKIAKLQSKRDEVFESYQRQSTFFAEAEKKSVRDLNSFAMALNNQDRIEMLDEKLKLSSALVEYENISIKKDDYLGMSNWGNYAKAKLAGSDFEHFFYNENREDEIVILEQVLEELMVPKDEDALVARMAELESEMAKIDLVLKDNGVEVPEVDEIRANSKYKDFDVLQGESEIVVPSNGELESSSEENINEVNIEKNSSETINSNEVEEPENMANEEEVVEEEKPLENSETENTEENSDESNNTEE
ncbi:MAG: hypothetical protein DWQ06_06285 [Calditrichaeota bacterium]|nr:MAG: hypothetical protein DWQ06_06285 [Calditrichota bacterium]